MEDGIKLLKELITYLKELGLTAPLILAVLAIILLVAFPDRAEKLKKLIIMPFFYIGRWFARSYISSSISTPVSNFINNDLLAFLDNPDKKELKVKINFISNTEELKKKKNTLIVRLREENDQTKNILTAASMVIPSIICPLVRSNIDNNLSKAIDLTVLRKLAVKRGSHGKLVFKQSFLDPELLNDPTINDYIEQLIRIDKSGLFISVFTNELTYLGEEMFANSDRSNRTPDVVNFLKFLIKIAEREIGEKHDLSFLSKSINAGIILLAKPWKAELHGLTPYLNRLQIEVYNGCESVYFVAYPPAKSHFNLLLKTLSNDERYKIVKKYKLQHLDNNSEIKIALVRTNTAFTDETFTKKLNQLGIKNGSIIEGKVTDVSVDRAVVTFGGLNCFIKKGECSWYTVISCTNELDTNQHYKFLIKNIDFSNGTIELSRRFDEQDPWSKTTIPKEGDTIEITPHVPLDMHLVCRTDNGLEVKVPFAEIVWGDLLEADILNTIGEKVKAKVLLVQYEGRLIRASIRQLKPNPWNEVKTKFPPGKIVMGTVIDVNSQFVTVEISNGIYGRVQKESFYAAGHEYRDFEKNLIIGQKLQVEVKKVWVQKEKISLELTRNLEGRATPMASDFEPVAEHKIVKMKSKRKTQ